MAVADEKLYHDKYWQKPSTNLETAEQRWRAKFWIGRTHKCITCQQGRLLRLPLCNSLYSIISNSQFSPRKIRKHAEGSKLNSINNHLNMHSH